MKFRVGDRVKSVWTNGSFKDKTYGRIGEVVSVRQDQATVDFGNGFHGHSGDFGEDYFHYWYVPTNYLVPAQKKLIYFKKEA